MSVELKVTLVGEDPQQQQAFNQPAMADSSQPSQPSQTAQPKPSQSASSTATPQPSSRATTETTQAASTESSSPVTSSTDGRLIDTIDQLISALEELTSVSKPTSGATGQASNAGTVAPSMFDRISSAIDAKIESFGLQGTAIGNMVSGLGGRFAGVGNRVATFASGALGRGAATTAAPSGAAAASAGATAAEGAAVAGGAGAAGGLGAGAAAGSAVAGPLVAVALAAGLAALSVKKFMEAIDSVAANLEDLSPEIAIGQGQYEARAELARLDRAQRIGPEVATLNNAQNRLSESMYELQTKIYELILKAAPAIELGANVVDVGLSELNVKLASAISMVALFTPGQDDNKKAADALTKANESLNNALLRLAGLPTQQDQDATAMIESMLGFGNQQQAPLPPPQRRRRQ